MNRAVRHVAVGAILLTALNGAAGADAGRTLKGSFVWGDANKGGDLEVVFEPDGEAAWGVAFHFEFRGQAHVYRGTARGSLAEGTLEGTVQNEDKKRTFKFQGTFQDGVYQGTHAEIEDGSESPTGTLTLKA